MEQSFKCAKCSETIVLDINGTEKECELTSKFFYGGGWLYQYSGSLCCEHRILKRIKEAQDRLGLAQATVIDTESTLKYFKEELVLFYKKREEANEK